MKIKYEKSGNDINIHDVDFGDTVTQVAIEEAAKNFFEVFPDSVERGLKHSAASTYEGTHIATTMYLGTLVEDMFEDTLGEVVEVTIHGRS